MVRYAARGGNGQRQDQGGVRLVTPAKLESIVMHGGRLEVLCCLLDNGPLALRQLSATTGRPLGVLNRWVTTLAESGLLAKTVDENSPDVFYAATIDDHPDWVREAVDRHRQR